MTSVSIICLRRDIDNLLNTLNGFGEFHIEQAEKPETNSAQITQTIQKSETALTDIDSLTKSLITDKTRLTDIFRKESTPKTEVTAENWATLQEKVFLEIASLKKQTTEHITTLSNLKEKEAELNHLFNILTVMDNMEFDLATADKLRTVNIIAASAPTKNLPDLETALVGLPIIFYRCYLSKETQFFCTAFPRKRREEIEKILKQHHGELFKIPPELPHDITNALNEINVQLKQNMNSQNETQSALKTIGVTNKKRILALRETLHNAIVLLHAQRRILQSGRLATVIGFTTAQKFHSLQEKISTELGENALVIENEVAPVEDPPTKISNNRFVRPFEEITKLYGLPHYDELDPTPILAVTFPLIFGLMFGDVGHGLILLLGGLSLGFLIKRNLAVKNVCWILAACGIGAIIAGLLFGEFFGVQVFAPLWFSPFDNVLSFLIFSLVVGVIQISSGLILDFVNYLLKRNFLDAILTTLPKVAFYAGSVYLIATYQLNFGVWLSGPILLALVPFLVLVFGKTAASWLGQVAMPLAASQKKVSIGERFFESSDFVARLMSNTMSYTRILALLMAHWALILVTYVVAGLVGSATPINLVVSGIIVVIGNLFVVALEGLIVFIHSLRLHFYEWFSKFFQGNGSEFTPYKQNFVYTELRLGDKAK